MNFRYDNRTFAWIAFVIPGLLTTVIDGSFLSASDTEFLFSPKRNGLIQPSGHKTASTQNIVTLLTHPGSYTRFHTSTRITPIAMESKKEHQDEWPGIDRQSDSCYGRGLDHLSAHLELSDAVIFRMGRWHVDGVEVGDGSKPTLRHAAVDSIQVVWTHDCEHGVIRGISLDLVNETGLDNDRDGKRQRLVVSSPMEFVEFGPEQLYARIPVEWEVEDRLNWSEGDGGHLKIVLPDDLFET